MDTVHRPNFTNNKKYKQTIHRLLPQYVKDYWKILVILRTHIWPIKHSFWCKVEILLLHKKQHILGVMYMVHTLLSFIAVVSYTSFLARVLRLLHRQSLIARYMGPTWVLSAPGGPHVGHVNLAIWDGNYIMAGHAIVVAKDITLLFYHGNAAILTL